MAASAPRTFEAFSRASRFLLAEVSAAAERAVSAVIERAATGLSELRDAGGPLVTQALARAVAAIEGRGGVQALFQAGRALLSEAVASVEGAVSGVRVAQTDRSPPPEERGVSASREATSIGESDSRSVTPTRERADARMSPARDDIDADRADARLTILEGRRARLVVHGRVTVHGRLTVRGWLNVLRREAG